MLNSLESLMEMSTVFTTAREMKKKMRACLKNRSMRSRREKARKSRAM